MKSKLQIIAFILIMFIFFSSCDTFKVVEIEEYTEAPKNIEGIWQLKTVSRNQIDITKEMNFSQFRLNLREDGSYTMDNYLPFAVKKNGQWQVDDPYYPFHLIFREEGSNTAVNIAIKYPIVDGKRNISVILSPGCPKNVYTYVFERINNN